LSFFLWSSIPDETLLAVAEQGKLSDPKILSSRFAACWPTRARTLTTNFAFEWLKIRDMDALEPDPFTYPAFDRCYAPLCAARWRCSWIASSMRTAVWWIF
jgi:hypothetical protein